MIDKTRPPRAANKILIVDDEESMRFFLSEAFKKEGYEYQSVANGAAALKAMEQNPPDVAVLDYNMPGMNGLETFKKIRALRPQTVGVLMTAFGDNNLAYESMENGMFDYFTKPFDLNEMRVVVSRALERAQLQNEIAELKKSLKATGDPFIVGNSRGIEGVLRRVEKIAASDAPVLILGESGTGKELIAQALHHKSARKSGPFIKVNCAAIPKDLLEAEFFGHEKGAFTGAVKQKKGKFELANGGSLFLDEIGDMPLDTQVKILRLIQDSELVRVGGESPVKIDVRLITATHKDLKQAIAAGEFREDLMYRLDVVSLSLPPLRERKEDVPLLAKHFLQIYNQKLNRSVNDISPEALDLLTNYSWPGNIRELENVIQRGIILSYGNILGIGDLLDVYPALLHQAEPATTGATLEEKMDAVVSSAEKQLILETLKATRWKRQEAADKLGISRKTLHNKMKKYDLAARRRDDS